MTVAELFEQSLVIALVVLLVLLIGGSYRFRPKRVKGLTTKEKLGRLIRYTALRLPVAIGVGAAFFILGAAALTLNSHRPPGDNSPVIRLTERSGEAVVNLNLKKCEGNVHGQVRYSGRPLGDTGPSTIFSDQDGLQPLANFGRVPKEGNPLGSEVRGSFHLTEPLARRGLLSCYLQLPVVHGANAGYEVRVTTGSDMEIDTLASVPPPTEYNRGQWTWTCPAGKTCPGVATISYAVESGTKQVIVLVLAAVFGSLIALLAGEVLLTWIRRRFDNPD